MSQAEGFLGLTPHELHNLEVSGVMAATGIVAIPLSFLLAHWLQKKNLGALGLLSIIAGVGVTFYGGGVIGEAILPK
jgi:hypothetical protein